MLYMFITEHGEESLVFLLILYHVPHLVPHPSFFFSSYFLKYLHTYLSFPWPWLATCLESRNHQGATALQGRCLLNAAVLVLTTVDEYGRTKEGTEKRKWRYKRLPQKKRFSRWYLFSSGKRPLRRNMMEVSEILCSMEKEIINILWNLLLGGVVRAKRIISFGKRFQSYMEEIDIYNLHQYIYWWLLNVMIKIYWW